MTQTNFEVMQTAGRLEDYFVFEGLRGSTRSSDVYKAVQTRQNLPVTVWRLRQPIGHSEEIQYRFIERLESIGALGSSVCDMLSFGIDSTGIGFCVFQGFDGDFLGSQQLEASVAERLLVACLRILQRIHDAGLVCGDICSSSFVVTRQGEVSFQGVLGSFDYESSHTTVLPPVESLHFAAPEQLAGCPPVAASDVYALGVLSYYLLTGTFPIKIGTGGQRKSVRLHSPKAPDWFDLLIDKALAPDPADRYQGAGEMLRAITDLRARPPQSSDEEARPILKPAPERASLTTHVPLMQAALERKKMAQSPASASQRTLFARISSAKASAGAKSKMVTVGVLLLLGALPFLFSAKSREVPAPPMSRLEQELRLHAEAAPSQALKETITEVSQPSVADEVRGKLEQLATSNDPLAHAVLVQVALDSSSAEERLLAERTVLNRARKFGMGRSAEQVRQWLRQFPSEGRPATYAQMLKLLDPSLPLADCASVLRTVSREYGIEVALRLAAGIALDSGKAESYQPLLAELLKPVLGESALKSSVVGLIISSPDLSVVYGEDVAAQYSSLSTDELLPLLLRLVERQQDSARTIARLVGERRALPPARLAFVEPLKEDIQILQKIKLALVRGAQGTLSAEDVGAFGAWYDHRAEEILLSVLADNYPDAVKTEAFEVLSNRAISSEPAATLIEWVREAGGEDPGRLVSALAVLGMSDGHSEGELRKALDMFKDLLVDSDHLERFIQHSPARLVRLVIERYAAQLGPLVLLRLLPNAEKDLRIEIVRAVAAFNDVGTIQRVLEAYDAEQDPDVREEFRAHFWVVKDRP